MRVLSPAAAARLATSGQAMGGRYGSGGALPGGRCKFSETQDEIGCTGFATAGRSTAIAEAHSIAQHGPGEPLPSC